MTEFDQRIRQYQQDVVSTLEHHYGRFDEEPQSVLFESMQYSLLAGGKRLRPVLAYEFCRMCCGDWKKARPFAAAVEMVHTYSLIHDDLPCMDNDDYRRGRLTNHKVYGEALAVLAGDALLTDAFGLAASAKLDGPAVTQAVGVLSECAGSLGMVGGQVLDILSEDRECTEAEILAVQNRKTGALIKAACALGAIAGGADQEQFDAACVFAASLGLAFQIRDDMLDMIGDQKELGKAVGVDAGKNTFVRLYGLQRCEELVRQYTDIAIDALSVFPDRAFLTQLALQMTDRRI